MGCCGVPQPRLLLPCPLPCRFAGGGSWSLGLSGERGSVGPAPCPPPTAVSGACFPLPAFCCSDSGSESKSGRLRSCCWGSRTWGAVEKRDGGSSQACWAVQSWDTHCRGQGSSGHKLGEENLFKGYYTQAGLVGNWWGSITGSADVSPCQHLLSVPHEDEQQGWSTQSPAQHPWVPLFPKPFGHPHPGAATSLVGLWHPG